MTLVVSDTSPIRALDFLGQMPLLEQLFEKVLIPPAVRDELSSPLPKFSPVNLSRFDFVEVRKPRDARQVQQFMQTLDIGESEAIALAIEEQVEIILMDELSGRKIAEQYGFTPVGALGVLLRAKSRQLISELRPMIEALDGLEFYMTPELKTLVLHLAGEDS